MGGTHVPPQAPRRGHQLTTRPAGPHGPPTALAHVRRIAVPRGAGLGQGGGGTPRGTPSSFQAPTPGAEVVWPRTRALPRLGALLPLPRELVLCCVPALRRYTLRFCLLAVARHAIRLYSFPGGSRLACLPLARVPLLGRRRGAPCARDRPAPCLAVSACRSVAPRRAAKENIL